MLTGLAWRRQSGEKWLEAQPQPCSNKCIVSRVNNTPDHPAPLMQMNKDVSIYFLMTVVYFLVDGE